MESYAHKFALLFPLTVVLCALSVQDTSAGPPTPNPGELVTAQLLLIIIIIGADCSSS